MLYFHHYQLLFCLLLEALNSMFVVELAVKFKSPETYKVPILLPGAIVPFVTVTLPPIIPPPPNTAFDPLTVTLVLKIVSEEDDALPAYRVPFETVISPEIVLSPKKVNVPVPDLVKLPDPEKTVDVDPLSLLLKVSVLLDAIFALPRPVTILQYHFHQHHKLLHLQQ